MKVGLVRPISKQRYLDKFEIPVKSSGSIKAPEFSHTENRFYAIIPNGALKHLAYYDENHKQYVSMDLLHPPKGVQPHKLPYLKQKNF